MQVFRIESEEQKVLSSSFDEVAEILDDNGCPKT